MELFLSLYLIIGIVITTAITGYYLLGIFQDVHCDNIEKYILFAAHFPLFCKVFEPSLFLKEGSGEKSVANAVLSVLHAVYLFMLFVPLVICWAALLALNTVAVNKYLDT